MEVGCDRLIAVVYCPSVRPPAITAISVSALKAVAGYWEEHIFELRELVWSESTMLDHDRKDSDQFYWEPCLDQV